MTNLERYSAIMYDLYLEGSTLVEIAFIYGTSHGTVSRLFKANKFKTRRGGMRSNMQLVGHVAQLYREGGTVKDIAQAIQLAFPLTYQRWTNPHKAIRGLIRSHSLTRSDKAGAMLNV